MDEHKWAEVLRGIADGRVAQWRGTEHNVWVDMDEFANPICHPEKEWRLKHNTININGYEVPKPEQRPPKNGQTYYTWDVDHLCTSIWFGDKKDQSRLAKGLVHLSEDAAKTHRTAALSFTRVPE